MVLWPKLKVAHVGIPQITFGLKDQLLKRDSIPSMVVSALRVAIAYKKVDYSCQFFMGRKLKIVSKL